MIAIQVCLNMKMKAYIKYTNRLICIIILSILHGLTNEILVATPLIRVLITDVWLTTERGQQLTSEILTTVQFRGTAISPSSDAVYVINTNTTQLLLY